LHRLSKAVGLHCDNGAGHPRTPPVRLSHTFHTRGVTVSPSSRLIKQDRLKERPHGK